MKVLAHAQADEDALLVEATSGKIYLIKIRRNSRNPNEIEELIVAMQRDGRTTKEDKEIAAKVMEALDALFAERDDLEEAQSTGALSVARSKMISDLLQSEQAQTEFDRDVFSKLIEVVRVYNRDDITFIFKDGTEVKADNK